MNKTVNIDIQVQSKSLLDIENELAQINEELKGVAVGSDAFKNLSKQSQEVSKELNKVNKEVEGFTADKKFQAADGAIKGMAGSLAGVVGVLGLVGVESDTFGEMEKKAASAIAVAMGVKDVSEGIRQMADANVLAAAKAKIMGLTTKQALIATGIGAFVVILGSIIAYWDDITAGVEKLGEKIPFVGKAIDAIKGAFDALVNAFRPVLEFLGILPDAVEQANNRIIASNEKVLSQGDRELALAVARKASAQEVFKIKEKMLKAELDNLKRTGAEKDEIYKKETELLSTQVAEQTRIKDEAAAADRARVEAAEAARKLAREKEIERINKEFEEMQEIKLQQGIVQKEQKLTFDQEGLTALSQTISAETALREEQAGAQEALEQRKIDAKKNMFDNLVAIAGAETNLGRVLLIAKQANAARELIIEASKTLAFSSQAVARSTVAVAEGTAQTAKIGFPQNIPMLIGYAAQAAGIISAIRGAAKGAKSIDMPNISTASGGSTFNGGNQNTTPIINSRQSVSRAYVLSGDVTSNQEADAKLSSRRTVG